jgi:two-component system, OmpR family, KDP operon response regulator KdpE
MSRPQRIWVVNDEAPIARVLRHGLAAPDYEATVASEGEEELEIINSWAPGLVITEISMPNMGGLELCH